VLAHFKTHIDDCNLQLHSAACESAYLFKIYENLIQRRVEGKA